MKELSHTAALFKGQEIGASAPENGNRIAAVSPCKIHNRVPPRLCFDRFVCRMCRRGGLVFNEGCIWTGIQGKGFLGSQGHEWMTMMIFNKNFPYKGSFSMKSFLYRGNFALLFHFAPINQAFTHFI